jgi:hypothetical protein
MNVNLLWRGSLYLAGLAGVVGWCSSARADTWHLTPEVKEITNTFGNVQAVLHYDSTRNRSYPEYALKIYRDGKLLGEHKGVAYKQVFADSENRYFVGVSNSGLTKTAYVVFDRDGRILRHQPHGAPVKYCRMSVSVMREWFDEKKPEPEFKVDGGKLKEVSVRGCKGDRVQLPL